MQPLYTDDEFEIAKSRQPLPLSCLHCQKTFHLTKHRILEILNPNRTKTGDFCSRSCSAQHRNPPIDVVCDQCQKSFKKPHNEIKRTKNHFCCRSCAGKWHNEHKTTGTRVSRLERWLQSQLPILYPPIEFHFNRTDAINGELDIYIPSLKLAFELNGIFHYEPIFGPEKLSKMQNNDSRKSQACHERGIELCVIDTSHQKYFKEQSATKFLNIIQNVINMKMVGVIGIEPTT